MLENKELKKKSFEDDAEKALDKKAKIKKIVALKTTKIVCNGKFNLVKGEEIPKGIDEAFIKSLINSNLIK